MNDGLKVSGSGSIYESLSFNTSKKTTVQNNEELPELNIQTQDTRASEKQNTGRIPSSSVSFDENPIQEQYNGELPNLDEIASNQSYSPDDLPQIFDENNIPQYEENPEEYKPSETSKSHSTQKALVHFEAAMVTKGITNLAQKVVTNAASKAVAKELTEAIASVTIKASAKSAVTVSTKVAEAGTVGVTKAIAELTTKGALGKGVATLTLKEVSKVSGGVIKGLEASAKASSELLLKEGAKKIIPNAASALTKTSIGAGEKVLQKGIEKGAEKAVNSVLEKLGTEVAGQTITKTTEKALGTAVTKAVQKGSVEAAAKGSTKVASKVAAAMPWVNAAIGTAITVWDAKDAIEKTRDPKASKASVALAWTTVGLDVVSTVTSSTGVGKPVGWVATGAGIGTSILSDYLR